MTLFLAEEKSTKVKKPISYQTKLIFLLVSKVKKLLPDILSCRHLQELKAKAVKNRTSI